MGSVLPNFQVVIHLFFWLKIFWTFLVKEDNLRKFHKYFHFWGLDKASFGSNIAQNLWFLSAHKLQSKSLVFNIVSHLGKYSWWGHHSQNGWLISKEANNHKSLYVWTRTAPWQNTQSENLHKYRQCPY